MRIRDLFDQATARSSPSSSSRPRPRPARRRCCAPSTSCATWHPSFVSVTYGAGGSTREKTIDIVTRIKREHGIEAMAHLTCVGHDRDEIAAILDRLAAAGIENVLPLRGDPPQGESRFRTPGQRLRLRQRAGSRSSASAATTSASAGAGYPEGHQECRDLERDIAAPAPARSTPGSTSSSPSSSTTTRDYFAFVERARRAGITVPIVPGIMPITNVAQIERIARMCGARIPAELQRRAACAPTATTRPRCSAIGIEHATRQCRELLAGGAPGIHFYTLNQSPATAAILAALRR